MVGDKRFQAIVGVDLSWPALAALKARLGARAGTRLTLLHGSFTDPDPRLAGFDAAVLLETIEHIDPGQLSKLERTVFTHLQPRTVIITTPNVEYNVVYGVPPGRWRHPDHRFEWPRDRFAAWVEGVARRCGYQATTRGIGWPHPRYGPPTQIAEFRRRASQGTKVCDNPNSGGRMTQTQTVNSEALLRQILETIPDATLDEIRAIHPVFRGMSNDHLGLRLGRFRQHRASTWEK